MNEASQASEPLGHPEQVEWFMENVQPHEPLLRNYLHGSFRNVRDLDDVVQESYARIWKARKFGPIQSAKAFLFQVARHIAVDLIRREKVNPIIPVADLASLSVLDSGLSADEVAIRYEETQLLAEALYSLPPKCREIVILRKLKNVSQKDIAAMLGLSELTVQNQVFRGIKRCEKFLTAKGVVRPSFRKPHA
jgi:RNA polymerase sigma-70 factor (ECF subfamily)